MRNRIKLFRVKLFTIGLLFCVFGGGFSSIQTAQNVSTFESRDNKSSLVTVAGRVATADGRGIGKARVTILNTMSGERQTISTNPFGYFQFEEIEVGITYVIEVNSKRYTFESQAINVTDAIEGLTFTPTP